MIPNHLKLMLLTNNIDYNFPLIHATFVWSDTRVLPGIGWFRFIYQQIGVRRICNISTNDFTVSKPLYVWNRPTRHTARNTNLRPKL